MKLTLPYSYELGVADRGGTTTRVYRDTVTVMAASASHRVFHEAFELGDGRRIPQLTYSFNGRLFRQATSFGAVCSPARFVDLACNQRRDLQPRRVESWSRVDFLRPSYVRSLRFDDRSAVYANGAAPPLGQANLDSRMQPQRREEARLKYERDIVIGEDCVWLAVPEPTLVLRQRQNLAWHLAVEPQPTIWEAATSFSLDALDKAVAFADSMAFDVAYNPRSALQLAPIMNWSRIDILDLAASTIALAGHDYPDLPVTSDYDGMLGLVRRALIAIGGDYYPWRETSRPLDPRVKAQLLRRRWQFELRRPEHQALLFHLWSDSVVWETAVLDCDEKPKMLYSLDDQALADLA